MYVFLSFYVQKNFFFLHFNLNIVTVLTLVHNNNTLVVVTGVKIIYTKINLAEPVQINAKLSRRD